MAKRRRVLRKTSGSDKDVCLFIKALGRVDCKGHFAPKIRMSISGGRREGLGRQPVRRALNCQEGTGKRKATSHHHAVLDNP